MLNHQTFTQIRLQSVLESVIRILVPVRIKSIAGSILIKLFASFPYQIKKFNVLSGLIASNAGRIDLVKSDFLLIETKNHLIERVHFERVRNTEITKAFVRSSNYIWRMMLEMKQSIKLILACAAFAFWAKPTQAQTIYELQIDSIIAFPDTVENGATVSFYMMVSLQNTPLLYQGNIFLELEYGNVFYPVDSVESAIAFLSPNFPNQINATHRFTTDNDLSIGDNVVVVWPRIGNGTDPIQVVLNPFETIITLVEPNGISEHTGKNQKPLFYPNPANSTIDFVLNQLQEINSIEVHDAFGKMVLSSAHTSQLDVSQLPVGIYMLSLISDNQRVRSERLVIFH